MKLKWTVAVFFAVIELALTIAILASFPGYEDASYTKWSETRRARIFSSMSWIWFLLCFVSTMISIYAINRQYNIVVALMKMHPGLSLKVSEFILHGALMIVLVCTQAGYILSLTIESGKNFTTGILGLVDILTQMCIMWICWKRADD